MTQNSSPTGVTVTIPANTTTNEITHQGATVIEVIEGHLKVRKPAGSVGPKTIALYAPGKWLNAVVNYAS